MMNVRRYDSEETPVGASSRLFDPLVLRGGRSLRNRVVMAPMTRSRASDPGDVPSEFAADYYGQRATAGLIVTEATNISLEGKGYSQTPGIYTSEQARRWGEISRRVHDAVFGSTIFMQLWHVGRLSTREVSGMQPIAPDAVRAPASVWVRRADGWSGLVACDEPRAMTAADVARVVRDFAAAAGRAVEAGLDGIELHGANGYLIDQFLRSTTNHRTDTYGGSPERRLHFLQEVVTAVKAEVGPARLGIRLSPVVGFSDAQDPEMEAVALAAARWLDGEGLAYLHLAESDVSWLDADAFGPAFRERLREAFLGPIIVAAGYDRERADAVLDEGLADLVAFGRPFIANPDLVERLRRGAELREADRSVWYGGSNEGYTSYPALPAP